MRFLAPLVVACLGLVAARIEENGQVRLNPYPGQAPVIQPSNSTGGGGANSTSWTQHSPNATELSYKGRWDSQHISWWSAPGLKFGFTGKNVAITFGQYTDPGVLVGYRVDGLDWQFSNVTAGKTYHFISPENAGEVTGNATQVFELRVTNWSYGVQIKNVWTASKGALVKIPNHPVMIEMIGDSLTSGMYATYEGLSSFGYGIGAGLGNVEYSITAYPGICLHDANCWGNPRGQTYQWLQTSDTSYRASVIHGEDPEPWDFSAQQDADYVLINLGTNDNNTANSVSAPEFYTSYIKLIDEVHEKWPAAQVVISSIWNGFYQYGNMWYETGAFKDEVPRVAEHFKDQGFVHLFNTTGILQHNDIGPQWHPTDFGHLKVASHMIQYLKNTFGLELGATGPMVQSGTLYWNTESGY